MLNSLAERIAGGGAFPWTFGRYAVLGVLGSGGMARVYRAELLGARGFRKPCALKVIRPAEEVREQQYRRALLREAQLGALLHHAHVVETYDYGEVDGLPFIAMELVDGPPLGAVLHRFGAPPPSVCLDIAIQACLGLHHAHELSSEGRPLGLVHRDLKPNNILIARDGSVKVADFGIAHVVRSDGSSTATGFTRGTPAYMSPEQVSARTLDRRSDVFALGAVLFEMLTGSPAFEDGTLVATMLRVVRCDELLSSGAVRAQVSAKLRGVAGVLETCLALEPERRFATTRDLADELRTLKESAAPGPSVEQWIRELLADWDPADPQRPVTVNLAVAWAATESHPRAPEAGAPSAGEPQAAQTQDDVPAVSEPAPRLQPASEETPPPPQRAPTAEPAAGSSSAAPSWSTGIGDSIPGPIPSPPPAGVAAGQPAESDGSGADAEVPRVPTFDLLPRRGAALAGMWPGIAGGLLLGLGVAALSLLSGKEPSGGGPGTAAVAAPAELPPPLLVAAPPSEASAPSGSSTQVPELKKETGPSATLPSTPAVGAASPARREPGGRVESSPAVAPALTPRAAQAPAAPPAPPPAAAAAAEPASPAQPPSGRAVLRHSAALREAAAGATARVELGVEGRPLDEAAVQFRHADGRRERIPMHRAGELWTATLRFDPGEQGTAGYWFEAREAGPGGDLRRLGSEANHFLVRVGPR